MTREQYNAKILGESLYKKITSSRVLLVGAGGIGCELLKNLVMTGFPSIEVVCFSPAHKICKEFKRSNTFGRRLISTRLI